jgi:enoyl-CoA hydratase/carnithine racemase
VSDLVLVSIDGGTAVVTLNRPAKRNALSIALRRELADVFASLASSSDAAVVVLTGAGPAFCAGMDKSEFGGDLDHKKDLYETSRRVFETIAAHPRPVIAAVNGPALGGGNALAAVCDVRICSPTATFGHPEVALGIPASLASLLRIVAEPEARYLALTGAVIDAEEALRLGIVRAIVWDPLASALSLSGEMLAHGAAVLEATKRIMIEATDPAITAAYEAEMALFRRALFGAEGA